MSKEERVVPAALSGARLDKALVDLVPGASRARVKKAIESGGVRVNGKINPKGGVLVNEGDTLSFTLSDVASGDEPPTADPSVEPNVRFENDHVIVVDKPAGLPCAPLKHGEMGTLANGLVAKYPNLVGVGYSQREPGLLHRLDTETSGVLIVAKTKESFERLKNALKDDQVQKEYLLVCSSEGLPDEGTIEFPIANHPKDQRRVYPCMHPRDVMRYAPRPASTRYEVVRRGGKWALVRVEVARALRHQIRAHFAAIGLPLAGDVLYGGEEISGLKRHALHASRVAYTADPALGFDVRSDLPRELEALIEA